MKVVANKSPAVHREESQEASPNPAARARAGAPIVDVFNVSARAPELSPALPSRTTLPNVAESFPIGDLSLIAGKGAFGSTFMLDGGALRGLALSARRVKEGKTPGIELHFGLTPEMLARLTQALTAASAKRDVFSFPSMRLDKDGIAVVQANGPLGIVAYDRFRSAPKTAINAAEWCLRLAGAQGSQLELMTDRAAKALRGYVRVTLRGSDAECTKQLQAFVKQLGLERLFAPPTPKSKERLMLMRALWQADHATCERLCESGIDALTPDDVRAALEHAGYTSERLQQMRWDEVYPGHFSTIDPVQKELLMDAGARYLYSSVSDARHVLAILRDGQKASLRRYAEGLVVNGMSTNADFASGGAVGVFTRLVTETAIQNGNAWLGRVYKIVLAPELLARTDWHGWDSDQYGCSYDLTTPTNFGVGLVERIGEGGYRPANELVFKTGIDPRHIARIVATEKPARTKLIRLLEAQGYVPPNGMSLEDFVVYSPRFIASEGSPGLSQQPR